jgi:SAM-dependent methyltransferase
MEDLKNDRIRQAVRQRYSQVAESSDASCGCRGPEVLVASTGTCSRELGYSAEEISVIPQGADMGLGCGNPQVIAALKPGEVVLDLGSGGGFDCFLAARAVGDTGRVIGVDMTPAMVSKARAGAASGGYQNVEFRLGEIENLPVADATVDIILSNCVINLSPDKLRVFAEALRVLKPGGRLAISDIVAFADLPEEVRQDMALYVGCVAGASTVSEIEAVLEASGFTEIRVLPQGASEQFIRGWAPGTSVADYVVSATIQAVKPGAPFQPAPLR